MADESALDVDKVAEGDEGAGEQQQQHEDGGANYDDDEDEQSDDVEQDLDFYLSDGEDEHDHDLVRPQEVSSDTSCLVILDGLPIVPRAKFEVLNGLMTKKVLPMKKGGGDPVKFTMPFDEKAGQTYGLGIVEYATPKQAKEQVERLNGFDEFKFKISASPYAYVRKLTGVPDVWEDKRVEDHPEYQFALAQTRRSLHAWLTDKRVRDQFMIRFAKDTEVHWADAVAGGNLDYGGEREKPLNWCEMHVGWSPRGTYLLTQHQKGVALWGGSEWEKVLRIPCENVFRVQFSPNEEFLFTWDGGGNDVDRCV